MAEARFDLVILHHTSDKSVEDLVQELLQLLGKAGDPYLEYKLSEALLFEQSSSAILDGVELAEGENYQEKFRQLNVETALRPTLQLVEKEQVASDEGTERYVCPACQHTQAKETSEDAMNTCNKCGVVGEKLERNKRKAEVLSSEKRKLVQTQEKEMQEATVRARSEDEAEMRREAQEKLGIRKKKNVTNALVGTGVVAAMAVASFFIVNTLMNSSEEVPADNGTTIATNGAIETKKQPLITIQAGNGSIVINNNKPDGTNGSKGSAGEMVANNGAGSTESQATTATNQSNATTLSSNGSNPQNGQALTANSEVTASATTNTQPAGSNATSTQKNQQLAALTQKTISNITTTPAELDILNSILSSDHEQEYFFNKLNKKQYEEHQVRLQRLLKLNEPELALIFAEGMDDPYPASLMVLDIAKHVAKTKDSKLFGDLLLSMKTLASQGSTAPQKAMLSSNLSQIYDFSGDQDSAQALLEQSVKLLEDKEISRAEQCQFLAQIEQSHRKLGNPERATFIAETIVNFAASLSDEEYVYSSRAYTHLAAASLTENNQDDAEAWLNQIPAKDARQYLLAQMESISAAADKIEGQ